MLGASLAPALLHTRSWDPERPCTCRLVSQSPWLDAQAMGRLLRAIWLQRKHSVWLCIPIKTCPFAAGVKFPSKMPVNLSEGLHLRSCWRCA